MCATGPRCSPRYTRTERALLGCGGRGQVGLAEVEFRPTDLTAADAHRAHAVSVPVQVASEAGQGQRLQGDCARRARGGETLTRRPALLPFSHTDSPASSASIVACVHEV
ncbi:MAG: hypothetical protein ACK56I_01790 [bacterium]